MNTRSTVIPLHCELTFGSGMIMVATAQPNTEYGRLTVQLDEIGGRETRTTCLIAADPHEIYRRAKAGGAKWSAPAT